MFSRAVCVAALLPLLACPSVASAAKMWTCSTVQRGDTAARMARRITRDANNAYAPWFQILDPDASAFIPKSQYDRIQPGWHACIDDQRFRPAPPALAAPGIVTVAHGSAARIFRWWWWVPIVFDAAALAWLATFHLEQRQAASRALERFGTSFIREFERPLLQRADVKSPLRWSMKLRPGSERGEILLAPNDGWHYPNLTDHRKNVEYDVERIVTLLGERQFACGRLATRGPWVVIQFRRRPA